MADLPDYSHLFKKFHLGCGTVFIPGYLNIGYWSHLGDGCMYANPNGAKDTFLLNHDLVKGIPAADGSLDAIYHSHLLEHLSRAEGVEFTAACFRVLRPGGLLRVLVPDLELWARSYVNGNQFFFDEYRRLGLGDDRALYPTHGAVFMGMLHNHGHKMGYDFETLKLLLETTGFIRLRRTLMRDSDLPEIAQAEGQDLLRSMESLCVECYKPG